MGSTVKHNEHVLTDLEFAALGQNEVGYIRKMKSEDLTARFSAPQKTAPLIVDALAALEELGMVHQEEARYRLAG